ncbi:MAG: hypothetical protein PVH68_02110, partial [Armatimonadota bacterium]
FARGCLTEHEGHACATSTFVDDTGEPQPWHDFGVLEGPGWAANAVGGAQELYGFARFTDDETLADTALSLLDHVLQGGFIDYDTGFIRGYRHIPTGRHVLNYQSNSDWFCPGSMAKVAQQLLEFSEVIDDPARAARMQEAAALTAAWILDNVRPAGNGWWPRYCAPDGSWVREDDAIFDCSGDGLFVLALLADLVGLGASQHRELLAEKCELFAGSGGLFGSINHDTYDRSECVAYAVAFRTLRRAADVLGRQSLRRFAYEGALAGLARFRLTEDRNGVDTKGLLYMEDSWDTCYLWENAEAAQAYFEAAADEPCHRREYSLAGLTMLRAIARHHHGELGFLTEGVDWNNHVGAQHHFDGAVYGDIRYTEPLLNNLHIVTPTLYYLHNLAERRVAGEHTELADCEGNVLVRTAAGGCEGMATMGQ